MAISEGTNTFPDHLSVELDCLAVLEERGEHETAKVFAHEHLQRWLPTLTTHIREHAALAFYPVWAEGLGTMLGELYSEGA